jgi:hypothetical protein
LVYPSNQRTPCKNQKEGATQSRKSKKKKIFSFFVVRILLLMDPVYGDVVDDKFR